MPECANENTPTPSDPAASRTDIYQTGLINPAPQVYFRAGLIACREYIARFVESESATIAASIRANWWPSLGPDLGAPRQLEWGELVYGEFGTPEVRVRAELSPTIEALPIALRFLSDVSTVPVGGGDTAKGTGPAAASRTDADAVREATALAAKHEKCSGSTSCKAVYLHFAGIYPECQRARSFRPLLAVLAEAERKLPCGHHASLLVRSVESDHTYCQFCETRDRLRDALEMERTYAGQLAAAEQRATDLAEQNKRERNETWSRIGIITREFMAERKRAEEAEQRAKNAGDHFVAMQDDMTALMTALGIPIHARDASPHEVMVGEIIPKAAALTRQLATAREVLTELLRLYDWRNEVGGAITEDAAKKYGREKKAAWEAARKVLLNISDDCGCTVSDWCASHLAAIDAPAAEGAERKPASSSSEWPARVIVACPHCSEVFPDTIDKNPHWIDGIGARGKWTCSKYGAVQSSPPPEPASNLPVGYEECPDCDANAAYHRNGTAHCAKCGWPPFDCSGHPEPASEAAVCGAFWGLCVNVKPCALHPETPPSAQPFTAEEARQDASTCDVSAALFRTGGGASLQEMFSKLIANPRQSAALHSRFAATLRAYADLLDRDDALERAAEAVLDTWTDDERLDKHIDTLTNLRSVLAQRKEKR